MEGEGWRGGEEGEVRERGERGGEGEQGTGFYLVSGIARDGADGRLNGTGGGIDV